MTELQDLIELLLNIGDAPDALATRIEPAEQDDEQIEWARQCGPPGYEPFPREVVMAAITDADRTRARAILQEHPGHSLEQTVFDVCVVRLIGDRCFLENVDLGTQKPN